MQHVYRKGFESAFEAEETAKGFRALPGIDKLGPSKVTTEKEGKTYYVFVELAGEPDPQEVLEATGYKRVR